MCDVARAAEVAETTVYRRWPNTHDLAAAAIAHLAVAENPIPDTGSLEGYLRALLSQIFALLRRPKVERILRTSPRSTVETLTRSRLVRAFGAADSPAPPTSSSGQLAVASCPIGTDPALFVEFLVAPAYLRLLLLDCPLDDELFEHSVRATIAAFAIKRGDIADSPDQR